MTGEFKISVLASGSKGNASIITAGGKNFLIDAGISCRQLTQRMKDIGMQPEDLEGVLLTHEHRDHIGGLPVFCRKYHLPVFANEATWRGLPLKNEMEHSSCRLLPKSLETDGLKITSFAVPHDAAGAVGYVFSYAGSRCVYLTDVGFITEEIKNNVAGADTLVLEANHDEEMLKKGSYPYALKQRILGTRGHLSNKAAGWLLSQMQRLPGEVVLAHLSQENNTPQLALDTVRGMLQMRDDGGDTQIYVASQDEIVKNY